jgi:hypothetical protein
MTVDRFDDACCCVCARSAAGYGVTPEPRRKPPIWVCDDVDCLQIARNTYDMKQADFTRIESLASHEGKTDFRDFTEAEFFEANRRFIAGYREALKVKLRDEVPF